MGLTLENLHEYQHRTSKFIIDHPKCACWIDMGLGKTVSSLTATTDLLDSFEISNALVTAPLRVARKTWPDEIEEWAHTRHLRYSLVMGTPKQRKSALRAKADVYITNIDNVVWLESLLPRNRALPWDVVFLDESSGYKNRDTDRFKAMRRMSRRAARVVELTATPSPNSLLELWPQFYLLDGGQRLGETFTGYKERYFHPVQIDENLFKWVVKRNASKAIYDKIKDIVITLKARDYLKMPERIDRVFKVSLSEDEWAQYRELEREFVLELANGTEIEAVNAGALATKLLQLANGHVYDSDRNVHTLHSAKIEALREIVEANQSEPLLVAYSYQSDRDRILREFPFATHLGGNNSDAIIDRWNRGEIPMLLLHPKSGGHGLNLQYGGRHVVWFGLPWSLELYLQLNGRLDRQGQVRPVIVHHVVAEGTIDERVMSAISLKNATQEHLLNSMKELICDVIL